jgi:hypothetical protein
MTQLDVTVSDACPRIPNLVLRIETEIIGDVMTHVNEFYL